MSTGVFRPEPFTRLPPLGIAAVIAAPPAPYIPPARQPTYYRAPETRIDWEPIGPWFPPAVSSPVVYVPPARFASSRVEERANPRITTNALAFRPNDVPQWRPAMPARIEEARRDTQLEWFAPFTIAPASFVFSKPVATPQVREQPPQQINLPETLAFRFDDVPMQATQPAAYRRAADPVIASPTRALALRADDVPRAVLPTVYASAPAGMPAVTSIYPIPSSDWLITPVPPSAAWTREAARWGLLPQPFTASSDTLPSSAPIQSAAYLRDATRSALPLVQTAEPRRDWISGAGQTLAYVRDVQALQPKPVNYIIAPLAITFVPMSPPVARTELRDTPTRAIPSQVLAQTPAQDVPPARLLQSSVREQSTYKSSVVAPISAPAAAFVPSSTGVAVREQGRADYRVSAPRFIESRFIFASPAIAAATYRSEPRVSLPTATLPQSADFILRSQITLGSYARVERWRAPLPRAWRYPGTRLDLTFVCVDDQEATEILATAVGTVTLASAVGTVTLSSMQGTVTLQATSGTAVLDETELVCDD